MLVVGVGAGAHGARAILTHLDSPHRAPLATRTVRRRRDRSLASTAVDAISALHAVASTLDVHVEHSAIAYRSGDEFDAREDVGSAQLVPDTIAQLRYLRFTGTVPAHGATVLCDLGSTGMSVSVVDLARGAMVTSQRATSFGGDDLDQLVRRHLAVHGVRTDVDTARSIKERLSEGGVVNARDLDGRGNHVFTRRDFDDITAGPVRYARMIVEQTIELSGIEPASIVLLGGGANIASIAVAFESKLGPRIVIPHRPELVSARGAALLSSGQRLTNVG